MDVLYKGGSLLATQGSQIVLIALAAPLALLRALLGALVAVIRPPAAAAASGDAGCVFYEGVVSHARRAPVANAFE